MPRTHKKKLEDLDMQEVFDKLDHVASGIDPHDTPREEDHVFVTKELSIEDDTMQEKISKKRKKEKKGTKREDVFNTVSHADSEEITQKLTEIYENGDGSMPNMQKFEKRTRSKVLRAFFVLLFSCIFFATVAWLGFFVIAPQSSFSEDDVILSVSGDEAVMYGDLVTYRIRFRNAQNVGLINTALEIRYPKGFEFVTSSIATSTENNDAWNLGATKPQGSQYLDITGRLYGAIDEEQSFRVFLNYMPENFSSEFQKVAHVSVAITEIPFEIRLDGPQEVGAGAPVDLKVTLTPKNETARGHIQITCEGDTFSVKNISGSGASENNECMWNLDSVDEPLELNLSGSFAEDVSSGEKHSVHFYVRGWETADMNGDGYLLSKIDKDFDISKTNSLFNLILNGGSGLMNVEPGEQLTMSVQLKNTGETLMENTSLRVVIEAPSHAQRSMLDWAKLEVTGDADIYGKQLSDSVRQGEIIFDKRYISDLSKIMPGDTVHVDINIPIKNASQVTLTDFDSSKIRVYAELKYSGGDKEQLLTSNEINLQILSDLDLEVRDQISKNDGGSTVHTVTWLVSNHFHDLENLVLHADVYGDVSITPDDILVPAGEVEYDPSSKKITWKIDTMPTSVDVLALQIPIVMKTENPTQKNLTSKVTLKAHDMAINEDILKFGGEILLN